MIRYSIRYRIPKSRPN